MGVWVRVVARVPLGLGLALGACGGHTTSSPPDGTRVDTGTGTGTGTVSDTGSATMTMTSTMTRISCPPGVSTWCTTSSTEASESTLRVEDCTTSFPEGELAPSGNVFTCKLMAACTSAPYATCSVLAADHISTGFQHACAVKSDGTVRCWGEGAQGQLGTTDLSNRTAPRPVMVLFRATSVSAGGGHTCGVFEGGMVYCWGSNVYGQLGRAGGTFQPQVATGLAPAIGVSAGPAQTCAVLESGRIACWGAPPWSDETGPSSDTPAEVPLIDDALSVSVGHTHICALRRDGSVWCWGRNEAGQLGDGTFETREAPVQASGVKDAVAVASGGLHTCAVIAGGSVWCWGQNAFGQVDPGRSASVLNELPAPVLGLSEGVTAIAAGRAHTCAVVNGGVECWGSNQMGQLGNSPDDRAPRPVFSLSDVTEVSAGDEFSCARVGSGGVFCWGANAEGQLGNGTLRNSANPVGVVGN